MLFLKSNVKLTTLGWLRVVFAGGPRQAINAITLYSVMKDNVLLQGKHAAPHGVSNVDQFLANIRALMENDKRQALTLCAMLFTLIIWVFSLLGFISAVLCYGLFLWHHIPSDDGTLKRYCRRKINRRLERIVGQRINKALAKNVFDDQKPSDPEIALNSMPLQPTLPTFDVTPTQEKLPSVPAMPALYRSATGASGTTTLPPYSRPSTRQSDGYEWEDDVPLMEHAGAVGYAEPHAMYVDPVSMP